MPSVAKLISTTKDKDHGSASLKSTNATTKNDNDLITSPKSSKPTSMKIPSPLLVGAAASNSERSLLPWHQLSSFISL
jgi:hypothetical protein